MNFIWIPFRKNKLVNLQITETMSYVQKQQWYLDLKSLHLVVEKIQVDYLVDPPMDRMPKKYTFPSRYATRKNGAIRNSPSIFPTEVYATDRCAHFSEKLSRSRY